MALRVVSDLTSLHLLNWSRIHIPLWEKIICYEVLQPFTAICVDLIVIVHRGMLPFWKRRDNAKNRFKTVVKRGSGKRFGLPLPDEDGL